MIDNHIMNIAILPEILLDGECPKVTYDTLALVLHIETSKKYMDVPMRDVVVEDNNFSRFVEQVWNNHWKGELVHEK
jgi:hypothetical protein